MSKILITGGAGYIGSHTVVELIKAGADVCIVDNLSASDGRLLDGIKAITGKAPVFEKINICDEKVLRRFCEQHAPFDGIIHFAAYKSVNESVEKPLAYYQNNLIGMANVLCMMIEFSISKLVFSSSCSVYGQPQHLPVDESAPLSIPQSPYANTKKISEDMIRDVSRVNPQIKAIILRYFNPIGAHDSALIGELPTGIPNNLVPYITQTAIGQYPLLHVFGTDYNTPDGSCIRDFIHVVDLAKAHIQALNYEVLQSPEIFNIGTGKGVSVLELIRSFEEVTGVKLPIQYTTRRPGDVEQIWADSTKAQEKLGWQAEYSIKEALHSAWQWQKKLSDG